MPTGWMGIEINYFDCSLLAEHLLTGTQQWVISNKCFLHVSLDFRKAGFECIFETSIVIAFELRIDASRWMGNLVFAN
jgi:hypothetical protein